MWVLALWACDEGTTTPEITVEPLDLPDDPGAAGVPVGVRTETTSTGLTVEVWYPAAESTSGPSETVDFADWIPASVTDVIGPVEVAPVPTLAVRDAELRDAGETYPVVVFSHGFGGTRTQSVDLTVHWASRGYVVIATDHSGRSLADLLPCVFLPPLEGCTLAFDDPAVADVLELLAWLEEPPEWLDGAIDTSRLGLAGHSAGGETTTTVGNTDDRFSVLVPMAGGSALQVDTPTLRIAGTCDGIVPAAGSAAAHADSRRSDTYVEVLDAGHLAFADLCTLDLGALAEEYLVGREDVNAAFLGDLVTLGTDGCPGYPAAPDLPECSGAFADLEVTSPLLRRMTTVALDEALRGVEGVDLLGGSSAAVVR